MCAAILACTHIGPDSEKKKFKRPLEIQVNLNIKMVPRASTCLYIKATNECPLGGLYNHPVNNSQMNVRRFQGKISPTVFPPKR